MGRQATFFLGMKQAMDLYRYHGLLPLGKSYD